MRKTFIIIVILEAFFLGREWGGQTLARYTDKQHDEIIREYNALALKYQNLNGQYRALSEAHGELQYQHAYMNNMYYSWLLLFLEDEHRRCFNGKR